MCYIVPKGVKCQPFWIQHAIFHVPDFDIKWNDFAPKPGITNYKIYAKPLRFYAWWRHQMETFSALVALCAGKSSVTGEFPTHKGQWRRAFVFSLICAWINDWVNNHEAGDLRRYRAQSDIIVVEHSRYIKCIDSVHDGVSFLEEWTIRFWHVDTCAKIGSINSTINCEIKRKLVINLGFIWFIKWSRFSLGYQNENVTASWVTPFCIKKTQIVIQRPVVNFA